jgi:hypothetical protein
MTFQRAIEFHPLPKGEGRGEGEGNEIIPNASKPQLNYGNDDNNDVRICMMLALLCIAIW